MMKNTPKIKRILLILLTVAFAVNMTVSLFTFTSSAKVHPVAIGEALRQGAALISLFMVNGMNVQEEIGHFLVGFDAWWNSFINDPNISAVGIPLNVSLEGEAVFLYALTGYGFLPFPWGLAERMGLITYSPNYDVIPHEYRALVEIICDIMNSPQDGDHIVVLEGETFRTDMNTADRIRAIAFELGMSVRVSIDNGVANATFDRYNTPIVSVGDDGQWVARWVGQADTLTIRHGNGNEFTYPVFQGNSVTGRMIDSTWEQNIGFSGVPAVGGARMTPVRYLPFFEHDGNMYFFTVNQRLSGVGTHLRGYYYSGSGIVTRTLFLPWFQGGLSSNDIERLRNDVLLLDVCSHNGGTISKSSEFPDALYMTWNQPWNVFVSHVVRVGDPGSRDPVPWTTITDFFDFKLARVTPVNGVSFEDIVTGAVTAAFLEGGGEEIRPPLVLPPFIAPPCYLNRFVNGATEAGLVPANPELVFNRDGIQTIGGVDAQVIADTLGIPHPRDEDKPIVIPPTDLTGIIDFLRQILGRMPTQAEIDATREALTTGTDTLTEIRDMLWEITQPQIPQMPDIGDIFPEIPNFTNRFPFSIPSDYLNLMRTIEANEKVPIFVYDFIIQNERLGIDIQREIVIDLTRFKVGEVDVVREFLRYGFLLVFLVYLLKVSVKMAMPQI
jgi:hypothetical protein